MSGAVLYFYFIIFKFVQILAALVYNAYWAVTEAYPIVSCETVFYGLQSAVLTHWLFDTVKLSFIKLFIFIWIS